MVQTGKDKLVQGKAENIYHSHPLYQINLTTIAMVTKQVMIILHVVMTQNYR